MKSVKQRFLLPKSVVSDFPPITCNLFWLTATLAPKRAISGLPPSAWSNKAFGFQNAVKGLVGVGDGLGAPLFLLREEQFLEIMLDAILKA